jgi:transcriptional regulator with XRE-family HTH domain
MAAAGIEPVYIRMGERIAELRRKRGLTQERLVASAGVTANYLARVEGGQHRATLPKLEAIAAGLEVGIGALFGEAATKSPARILPDLMDMLRRLSIADQRVVLRIVEGFRAVATSESTSVHRVDDRGALPGALPASGLGPSRATEWFMPTAQRRRLPGLTPVWFHRQPCRERTTRAPSFARYLVRCPPPRSSRREKLQA